jgi:hypothetical protein
MHSFFTDSKVCSVLCETFRKQCISSKCSKCERNSITACKSARNQDKLWLFATVRIGSTSTHSTRKQLWRQFPYAEFINTRLPPLIRGKRSEFWVRITPSSARKVRSEPKILVAHGNSVWNSKLHTWRTDSHSHCLCEFALKRRPFLSSVTQAGTNTKWLERLF